MEKRSWEAEGLGTSELMLRLCLGFQCPGKVVAARLRVGTSRGFQLLLSPVMGRGELSERSRALMRVLQWQQCQLLGGNLGDPVES